MQRRLQGMRPDYLVQQREKAQKKLSDTTAYDQKMKLRDKKYSMFNDEQINMLMSYTGNDEVTQ